MGTIYGGQAQFKASLFERDYEALTTCGEWSDERDSVAALDEILGEHTDLFLIYREVRGQYLQLRPGQEDRQPRIDRLLTPNRKLMELGWCHGAIGIECKRSNEKIGPPLAQMTDYTRAVFALRDRGGVEIMPTWVFLWPLQKQHGFPASVMAQNRLGSAWAEYGRLHLYSGEQKVLRISRSGEVEIGLAKNGRRTGSR